MDHSLNLKAAERTLSAVTGLTDVRLDVVVDGVNKTLAGQCKRGDFYLRLSPAALHTANALKSEARTLAYITGHDAVVATRPFFEHSHAGAAFKWRGETYHGIATTVAMGSPFDDSNKQMSLFGSVLAKLHSIPVLKELEVHESSGAGTRSDAAATGPLAWFGRRFTHGLQTKDPFIREQKRSCMVTRGRETHDSNHLVRRCSISNIPPSEIRPGTLPM